MCKDDRYSLHLYSPKIDVYLEMDVSCISDELSTKVSFHLSNDLKHLGPVISDWSNYALKNDYANYKEISFLLHLQKQTKIEPSPNKCNRSF